jgi:cell division protein FtsB
MTEKRYYAHKHLTGSKIHDKICHQFMNLTETVEHMNMYYQKYNALKKENEQLKQEIKTKDKIIELYCEKVIE